MSSRVNCYLIRETAKARLFEIRATGQTVWIPKSCIEEMTTTPAPEHLEGKLPGTPALLRVAGWLRRKNAEAFGD